ncbi:MAG TPA: DUF3365 domain-containing protein [Burkholderiales bacterium]|jgi:hypothetical protein|nr:DUF3365 domain-containing protein [Burkholderiales bacterium]
MIRCIALFVGLATFPLALPAAQPDEARALAGQLVQRLGAALKQEMASGGPEQAITVCRDLAPALAGELSRQSGARVARVSLKTRNPLLGQPDAWEQAALLEFERRLAAGDKAEALEHFEIVDEPQGKALRYVKALPVQPLCLACHGATEALAEPVRAKLAAQYPHDRATGYAVGQIRGAVTVRQRLETAP